MTHSQIREQHGMSDTTRWCERGDHEKCDGILRRETGHHWWCACRHHNPVIEPSIHDHDAHKAWLVWKAARVAQAIASNVTDPPDSATAG